MTNLIFDLNNIIHRSLFIVSGYGKNSFTFDTQAEIDQLIRKIATDTAFIIRLINPSRVIFAQDDSSWRKTIKIDENEGYKANRFKSKKINWNNVYEAVDEFTEIMENNGMLVTKISTAEADDIISLWSRELSLKQNQHVIIVSGDEDLRQLVDYVPMKNIYVTVFNPFMQGKNAFRKLYVHKFFEDWINTMDNVDFMNMKATINIDKEDFRKIITAKKTKMEIIDGRMIGLRKIFCGDDGDNIPAFYSWLNDKNVEIRITDSKFKKIYEKIIEHSDELITHCDIIKRADKVLKAINSVTKQNFSLNIQDRILRQIKLVVLDPEFFPKEIIEKFEESKEIQLDKPRVNYSNLNMYNLLEGTRYVRERKSENEAPIFKQIDRIQGNALF